MKKIGLDFSPIYNKTVGGIPTFIENLIVNILNIDRVNKYYQCYKISRLKKYKTLYPKNVNLKRKYYDKKIVWFLKNLDLFHGPAEWIPIKLSKIPKIITIHDARGLENDSYTEKLYETKYLAVKKYADVICADSEFTKNEIIKRIKNINPDRIKVIYLAYNENKFFKNLEIKKNKNILFVGSIAVNKNVIGLIKAFNIIKDKLKNTNIIICGKNSDSEYLNSIMEFIKKENINDRVKFILDADENKLNKLYNENYLLVLPSFYEGFGLPILEAQACGTPVITSNICSMPEVGNNSVLYCNPDKIKSIADKILELYEDKLRYQELIELGFENIKRFSWYKTAENYIKIYKDIGK